MEKELIVSRTVRIPANEFRWSFVRSSGPGGQNVNKVNTKAVLRWSVIDSAGLPEAVRQRFLAAYPRRITTTGELVLSSGRYRDQGRNVEDCLARLQALIAAVVAAPKPRKATRPSRGQIERRLQQKRADAERKQRRRNRPTLDE